MGGRPRIPLPYGWFDRTSEALDRTNRTTVVSADCRGEHSTVVGARVPVIRGKVMSLIRQRRRRDPGRHVEPLAQFAGQPFSSADLVLLCSFGPDLVRPRTQRELRRALLLAGYGGPLCRHLILTSPLLQRRAGNRYVLHRFAP